MIQRQFEQMTAPFDMVIEAQRRYWGIVFDIMNQSLTRTATLPITRFTSQSQPAEHSESEQRVVSVGEEVLQVGKRVIPQGTTRVIRKVVSQPAEQAVELVDRSVTVERRKPAGLSPASDVLTEVTVEMKDSREIPVVSKVCRVAEEVVLTHAETRRVETVRDTVRRDVVEIEQPIRLPAVIPIRDTEQKQSQG